MIIGIVADDLTGAADSAAPFAARGQDADVQFHSGKLPADLNAGDVRAWSAGTRDLPAGKETAIRRLTRAVTRRLQQFSPGLYYKKIDSTLRGHLRIELDAMRIELPGRMALICPAFPANGRMVIGGVLHINGKSAANLRAAFGMQDDPLAADLSLQTLRDSSHQLANVLMAWWSGGIHTLFCDAETDDDMDILAEAVMQRATLCLPAGSAGLSGAVARRVPVRIRSVPHPSSVLYEMARGHCLVVVGSINDTARRQADCLAQRAGISPIVLGSATDYFEVEDRILQSFEAGHRIVLLKTPDAIQEPEAKQLFPGLQLTVRLFETYPDLGFVITGGETAEKTLARLGCNGIRILNETEPGVVCGRLQGGLPFTDLTGRPLVLKAGGFGNDETLARCVGL